MKAVLVLAASVATLLTNIVAARALDDVPKLMCSDVVSSAGSFTQKTEAMETWLIGYFDGITALSALDNRLQNVRKMDFNQLATVVLASCAAKPGQSVGETVTDIFALLINAQPGIPLELAMPRK